MDVRVTHQNVLHALRQGFIASVECGPKPRIRRQVDDAHTWRSPSESGGARADDYDLEKRIGAQGASQPEGTTRIPVLDDKDTQAASVTARRCRELGFLRFHHVASQGQRERRAVVSANRSSS